VNTIPENVYLLSRGCLGKVEGVILKDKETGNIVLDFSEFGKFEVLNHVTDCGIYGFWRPINPHPLDSLEDTTNVVEISVNK